MGGRVAEMKPIPKTFRKGGFDYKQVFRDGPWCIYRQTKEGTGIEQFEVVKLKLLPGGCHWMTGQELKPRESYPSLAEWGIRGWTCETLEAAHALLARQVLRVA